MNWVYLGIASFLSGVLASMGLGGGSVLMIYLTVIQNTPQIQAQGINLAFFIPTGLTAIVIHTKNGLIRWRDALWCYPSGLLGVWAASLLLNQVSETLLPKLFAGLLAVIGFSEIFQGLWPREKGAGQHKRQTGGAE